MDVITQDKYRIIHLTDGEQLPEATKLLRLKKADGINLNFVRNFPTDINILGQAVETKSIQINDYSWDMDYSILDKLVNLEHISLYTSDRKEINFDSFPKLQSVAIFWRPKAKSLFNCANLKSLFLGKYNERDLTHLHKLRNLNYLRINTGSVQSLKGIDELSSLRKLMIMQATRLEDMAGIEKLENLNYLTVDNCKNIKNIQLVKMIPNLETLIISGTTPNPDRK